MPVAFLSELLSYLVLRTLTLVLVSTLAAMTLIPLSPQCLIELSSNITVTRKMIDMSQIWTTLSSNARPSLLKMPL